MFIKTTDATAMHGNDEAHAFKTGYCSLILKSGIKTYIKPLLVTYGILYLISMVMVKFEN